MSSTLTDRRAGPDRCPGALQLHTAADGLLARVRVPGGRLTAARWNALARLAAGHGDGHVELTSRANLQLRGVRHADALADGLAAAGLLPSATHERVRNVVASPLTGLDGNGFADVRPLVAELDRALIADPLLAGLPGRFLFALDDGRGDVARSDADLTAIAGPDGTFRLLTAGAEHGLAMPPSAVVPVLIMAARAFLAVRTLEGGTAWRLRELRGGAGLVAAIRAAAGEHLVAGAPTAEPVPAPTVGRLGRDAAGVLVPLGRLSPQQLGVLGSAGEELVVTPWRGVVVPGAAERLPQLAAAGLETEPASAWAGVTTCAGRPGCVKSLSDVRADASVRTRAAGRRPALPVHWIGCERGCGSPAGRHVRVLATGPGAYEVERVDGRSI